MKPRFKDIIRLASNEKVKIDNAEVTLFLEEWREGFDIESKEALEMVKTAELAIALSAQPKEYKEVSKALKLLKMESLKLGSHKLKGEFMSFNTTSRPVAI